MSNHLELIKTALNTLKNPDIEIYRSLSKSIKLSFFFFATGILSLSTVAYAKRPGCAVISSNATRLPTSDMIKSITTLYQTMNVPALILGIVYENDSVMIACGETANGNNQRPTGNTIWPIGSVSKVFTGTILAEMVYEKKVALTDPVEKFFSTPMPSYDNRKITLLDLVTHTSGLDYTLNDIDLFIHYQNTTFYDDKTAMDWLKQKKKLTFKPGTYYLYSNLGFGLLGAALANAENTTYTELLKKYIVNKMDLQDTTIELTDEQKKREVKSYWVNDDQVKTDWKFGFEIPSGGIYSSGNDLLKFIRYHLNETQTQETISTNMIGHATYIYQNTLLNPAQFKNDGMSLGWHVEFPKAARPLTLDKNGWVNGVTTWVIFAPAEHIGVFSITNKPYLNIEPDLRTIISILARMPKKIVENGKT